jgi:hypothetical protein
VIRPELEPLPPELSRLLVAERSRPAPPAAMEARVLARIGRDLLANVPLAGPPTAGAPPSLPLSGVRPSRFYRLPMTIGLAALSGLGGAGIHALLQKTPRTMSPIAAPSAPAPLAAPAVPPTVQPAIIDSAPPVNAAHRPEAPGPARRQASSDRSAAPPGDDDHRLPRDGELAAERALLEQARTALARSKPADALALLSRHQREFTKGRMVEERQALTILSLVADHQVGAARANAAKFRREFPNSMLLRTIDAAIEAAP